MEQFVADQFVGEFVSSSTMLIEFNGSQICGLKFKNELLYRRQLIGLEIRSLRKGR